MRTSKLSRYWRLLVVGFYGLILGMMALPSVATAANLPSGYQLTPVTSGYNYPTNIAWLPDGTMLVAEKHGIVRAFKDGTAQAQPFIDITSTTNDFWDRGLLGLAVDPEYNANHYVYLLRTYENGITGYTGTKSGQLVRVTINPATSQMVGGSMVVLLGADTAATCENLPITADCMASDSPSHGVGDVIFAPDGTMFVTTGDGSSFTEADPRALRSQNIDSLTGKLLRIDRNGNGVPGNPFYGDPDANRSKVWTSGLRNPWRLTLKPGTSIPYLVDVGWDGWEEVNVATPGANMGWPCYEGDDQQGGYAPMAGCQDLYAKVANGQATVTQPLTAWDHSGGSAAAVGGVFVTGASYPTSLQGAYLYGDYAYGFARTLRTDDSHTLVAGPNAFAQDMPGQVDIEQGPDGKIYVVSIADESNAPGTGTIYRLDYEDVTQPPVGNCEANQFRAEYFNGQVPGGAPTMTRCEAAPIDHNWQLGGPGGGVATEEFSARWTGNFTFSAGTYRFDAWADDGVRIFVDGQLVLNGWFDQAYTHYQNSATLTAGQHAVVVEYYDAFEDAAIKAMWTFEGGVTPPPTGCAAGQFEAQYFNALTPGGTAALTRCEAAPLNHDWQLGSPGAGVNNEVFSARWTGSFDFSAGQYRFNAAADDGVRILVDGIQVLNGWFDQPVTAYESTANVTAGTHVVTIEYYDKLEDAIISASWVKVSGGNTAPQATVTTPAATSSAPIGSTVSFSGTATDAEDGVLPGTSLAWNAVVRHCNLGHCHSHFLQQFTGNNGSFVFPDHGEEEYYVELSLTATDSAGATSTVQTVRIDPNRAPATCPADWYVAEYFNNTTLSGTPATTGCVQTVNYDWVLTSPAAGVAADYFSARFTTIKAFEAGTYQFTATGDDGIRLFIDDATVINGWVDQPATTYNATRAMTAGNHAVRLEFYDASEDAVAQLSWVKQ